MAQHQHLHRNFMVPETTTAKKRSWMFPLFECRSLHKYVCAIVFPCVPMNTVRRLLQRQYSQDNHDIETVSAGVLSSIPCVLGLMSVNRHMVEAFFAPLIGSKQDTNADAWWDAKEEEEAECDNGQRLKVAAACALYPLLVCPTVCWMRRRVIHEAEIESESLWHSGQVALCCWPCALVQMEDELQGDSYEARGMHYSLQHESPYRMSF